MARTSETAVALVIQTDLTTAQIEAFIDDASSWVDSNLLDKGYSSTILTAIEKYLACYFISLRDPRLQSTQIGDTQESYQDDPKTNRYLRAALGYDTSGAVEEAFVGGGRKRLRFRVAAGYDSTLGLGVTEA